MEQAKNARTAAKRQFTRSMKSLSDALKVPDIPTSTLERRFSELKKKWDTAQEAHDGYSAFTEELEAEDSANLDDWIDSLASDFDQIEIKTDAKVQQMNAKETLGEPGSRKQSVSTVGAVNIERMKFPRFEGEIRRFPQFREEFMKYVAPLYQEEQRAFVLKSYLTDSVREEVENCGEDYNAIWKRLDQRFGDRGKLINTILDEVTCLSQGKEDNLLTLQMIKVVEKAHRDLKRLGAEDEMYNATMIVTIEKKMPNNMKQEWAKEIAGKDMSSATKFRTLLECLENWRSRIEYLSDSVRTAKTETKGNVHHMQEGRSAPSSAGVYGENNGAATPVRGEAEREGCWLHQLPHPIWRCREFLSLAIEERIKLVEKYKACKVCLSTSCSAGIKSPAECKRWKDPRCRIGGCQEFHSRCMHPATKISGSSAHAEGETTAGGTILKTQ
jgi:hypothetical protein